jgi:hypothetical protein
VVGPERRSSNLAVVVVDVACCGGGGCRASATPAPSIVVTKNKFDFAALV